MCLSETVNELKGLIKCLPITGAYLEPSQKSTMELS